MIKIISGHINTFKTTKLIETYDAQKKGDGFAALKYMKQNQVHYYNAINLKSKEQKLLSMHIDFFQNDFEICCQIGPYVFNQETVDWVTGHIEQMINQNIQPIYFDELGMLELAGQGFHHLFKKMLNSKLDLIIVIRTDLIQKMKDVYQFEADIF